MRFNDLFTERDNETSCPLRIVFWLVFVYFMAGSIYNFTYYCGHLNEWADSAKVVVYLGIAVIGKALTEKAPL